MTRPTASPVTGWRVVGAAMAQITQPDRTPMSPRKAFAWGVVTTIAAGLFIFLWSATP